MRQIGDLWKIGTPQEMVQVRVELAPMVESTGNFKTSVPIRRRSKNVSDKFEDSPFEPLPPR